MSNFIRNVLTTPLSVWLFNAHDSPDMAFEAPNNAQLIFGEENTDGDAGTLKALNDVQFALNKRLCDVI